MSRQEIRDAATILRATPGMVVIPPELADALADWLDQCADRIERGHHTGTRHSHRVARIVVEEVC